MEKRKKFGIYGDMIAITLIIAGFLMMVQPLTMMLYTVGFPVILTGVILFNISSHY